MIFGQMGGDHENRVGRELSFSFHTALFFWLFFSTHLRLAHASRWQIVDQLLIDLLEPFALWRVDSIELKEELVVRLPKVAVEERELRKLPGAPGATRRRVHRNLLRKIAREVVRELPRPRERVAVVGEIVRHLSHPSRIRASPLPVQITITRAHTAERTAAKQAVAAGDATPDIVRIGVATRAPPVRRARARGYCASTAAARHISHLWGGGIRPEETPPEETPHPPLLVPLELTGEYLITPP